MNCRATYFIGISLLSFSLGAVTQAQTPHVWALRAGVNSSTFNFPVFDLHNRIGINLAISHQVIRSQVFSLDVEIEYAQRGYSNEQIETDGSGEPLGTIKAVTRLDYISIPLLLRISAPLSKTVQPYIFTGPSYDFRINRKNGVWDFSSSSFEDNLSDQFRKSCFSLTTGIGVEIPSTFAKVIRIEIRHSFSLTDILPSDSLWEQEVTMKSTGVYLSILNQAH